MNKSLLLKRRFKAYLKEKGISFEELPNKDLGFSYKEVKMIYSDEHDPNLSYCRLVAYIGIEDIPFPVDAVYRFCSKLSKENKVVKAYVERTKEGQALCLSMESFLSTGAKDLKEIFSRSLEIMKVSVKESISFLRDQTRDSEVDEDAGLEYEEFDEFDDDFEFDDNFEFDDPFEDSDEETEPIQVSPAGISLEEFVKAIDNN